MWMVKHQFKWPYLVIGSNFQNSTILNCSGYWKLITKVLNSILSSQATTGCSSSEIMINWFRLNGSTFPILPIFLSFWKSMVVFVGSQSEIGKNKKNYEKLLFWCLNKKYLKRRKKSALPKPLKGWSSNFNQFLLFNGLTLKFKFQ